MNRFYLLLAGTVVFAVATASTQLAGVARGRLLVWLIAIGCVWSSAEAYKFVTGSSPASRDRVLRPENVMLTQYAYFGFPVVPDYFTDGVDDPELENRLLGQPNGGVLVSNLAAAAMSSRNSAGHLQTLDSTGASVRLEPGRRYLANFEFLNKDFSGVLQIFGSTLNREYDLPSSGGLASFGIGGAHSHFLPLWTSNAAGEDISIRLVPSSDQGLYFSPLARVRVNEYDPQRLPIQVSSWTPFRAVVRSPKRAWLETPRMFQPGYAARVNSRVGRIERTSQGLVAVEVPPGNSDVEVDYRAPFGLGFLFWFSFATILGSVGSLAWRALKCEAGEYSLGAGPA